MARRRTLYFSLAALGLILLGTVLVLSTVSYYLAIPAPAYLTELEVPFLDNSTTHSNSTEHRKIERIPRILHQTWKSETLPPRWKSVSQGCRDIMPDYEYMLWTDASSREFIAEHYSWFLDTFDNYLWPIQRADAIRYFILHHYGGIYIDLDIGCLRPLDPLLIYPVILPRTVPVGISNDLMFAAKGHPFLAQTIHNLVTFDHSWVLNYPTVMFSTGPMFLSAQYSIYTSSHPSTPEQPGGEVRILPKSLYGKNAEPEEVPHSFFLHFYGSSWHSDDAAFVGFLGHWGTSVMWLCLIILIIGVYRLALASSRPRKYSLRRMGRYDVLLPRWTQRHGRWHIDLRWSSLPASASSTQPPSPTTSAPQSPLEEQMGLLPLPFDVRPGSPASSDVSSSIDGFPSSSSYHYRSSSSIVDTVKRAGNRASAFLWPSREPAMMPRVSHRRRRSRGVMFFLPAIFTQSQNIELSQRSPPPPPGRFLPPSSQLPPEKQRYANSLERAGLFAGTSGTQNPVRHNVHSSYPEDTSLIASSSTLIDLDDIDPSGS